MQVDGNPVHGDDIDHYLSGRYDANEPELQCKPYVKMSLLVKKKSMEKPINVEIWRNSANMIAERRFMFELLAFIKRSGVSGNKEVEDCIAKCSQHYGNILEQEEGRQQALLENLKSLTDKCLTGIGNMQAKIEKLFNQQSVELTAQKEKAKEKDLYAKKMDTRVTELMALLDSYKKDKEDLANRLANAEDSVSRLRGSVAVLEAQIKENEAAVQRAKDLAREVDQLKFVRDDLLKKQDEMQDKNNALASENEKLHENISDLEKKYQQLLMRYGDLEQKHAEITDRNAELEAKLDRMKDQNMELANDIKDRDRKISDLDDRYNQLLKKYQDLED
eukprot:2795901-Rhodomonas_salina.1